MASSVTEPRRDRQCTQARHQGTKEGKPALLEFITTQEKVYSTFRGGHTGGA